MRSTCLKIELIPVGIGLILLLLNIPVMGQDADYTVSGKVFSAKTGLPLADIGISAVNIQGEPARSGPDGSYEIAVSRGREQLLFSYPGFKDQIIFIHRREQIDVWMLEEDDLSTTDDIDLFFSEVPQKDIAGAVSSFRLGDFGYSPHPSFEQDLEARLSGLQVINRSGMPGEGAFFTSRGYASLNARSRVSPVRGAPSTRERKNFW